MVFCPSLKKSNVANAHMKIFLKIYMISHRPRSDVCKTLYKKLYCCVIHVQEVLSIIIYSLTISMDKTSWIYSLCKCSMSSFSVHQRTVVRIHLNCKNSLDPDKISTKLMKEKMPRNFIPVGYLFNLMYFLINIS